MKKIKLLLSLLSCLVLSGCSGDNNYDTNLHTPQNNTQDNQEENKEETITEDSKKDYNVLVKLSHEDAGTINGEGKYNIGDVFTLKLNLDPFYTFEGWYIYDNTRNHIDSNNPNILSSNTIFSYCLDRDNITFYARFEKKYYTVKVESNNYYYGAVKFQGEGNSYSYTSKDFTKNNMVVVFAVTKFQEYPFDGWYRNGVKICDNNFYSFTMDPTDIKLIAKWNNPTYSVYISSNIEEASTFEGAGIL